MGFGAMCVVLFLIAYLGIPIMTLNWYAQILSAGRQHDVARRARVRV